MGRSRTPRFLRQGISRRTFLRGAAAASALLGAQPLLVATAEGDPVSVGPPGTTPFRHGVASGDPLANRVILWTRVTQASAPAEIPVEYVVAADPGLQTVVTAGTTTAKRTRDYTVKLDITGLAPATTYYYRFATGGTPSPIGRTRTLPVGSIDRLRIAVLSCAALSQGYFNAYRQVAQRADLDLVVHLGDYIYEHGDGEYGTVRTYRPSTEILTLLDYRTRHNQYKADPDVQELHRHHPMIAIWDDHEIADNAWRAGAANHQSTEGSYKDRVTAAVRAYYDWMPVRPVSKDRRRLYRSFRIGNLAELFMLEERLTARDKQLEPNIISDATLFTEEGEYLDPDRDIISDGQQRWLADRMRASSAQWKLVGQGVMVAPARVGKTPEGEDVFFNPDQWDGYKPARDQLLTAIAGSGVTPLVPNTVVLTGDIHSSWGAELPRDPYADEYEIFGRGSLGVELVATSVTSPGFEDHDGQVAAGLRALNPHLKYVELTQRGYLLLDITPERLSGEWWYVDTVLQTSAVQSFGAALQTPSGSSRLEPGVESAPRTDAPPLAP
jgi:alkaline phosphatase D